MEIPEALKRITTPFITHGIYRSEEEVLQRLAEEYVKRKVQYYREQVDRLKSTYQMTLDEFAAAVQALCAGRGHIPALQHLSAAQQVMRAEDDLEAWGAAEEQLKRWRTIQAELHHAPTA
jgi:hypothetical protein